MFSPSKKHYVPLTAMVRYQMLPDPGHRGIYGLKGGLFKKVNKLGDLICQSKSTGTPEKSKFES